MNDSHLLIGGKTLTGGGRDDAVIIKDITNGSNCAVVPVAALRAP